MFCVIVLTVDVLCCDRIDSRCFVVVLVLTVDVLCCDRIDSRCFVLCSY